MSKITIKFDNSISDNVLKRTNNLAKVLDDTSNTNKTEFVFFKLQNVNFAIESRYATEVIFENNLQEFSFFPSFIKGIINVRGSVIPINDLSELIFEKPLGNIYEIIRIKYKNIDTSFAVDTVIKTDFIFNDLILNQTTEENKYKYTKNIIKLQKSDECYVIDLQSFFSDEKIIIKE